MPHAGDPGPISTLINKVRGRDPVTTTIGRKKNQKAGKAGMKSRKDAQTTDSNNP